MNPRTRQTLYLLGSIGTGVLTLVSVWHGMSGETATALTNVITALLGLLGIGATGTAAVVVNKQLRDGAFDPASTADQVITGINAAVNQVQNAAADLEKIKNAASSVLNEVPVVGPLAKQIIDSVKLP